MVTDDPNAGATEPVATADAAIASRPKPPTFCARDPPLKDGHTGFTCMEHKCWPGTESHPRSLPCANAHKLTDTWGTGFFACMCTCCEVPCKTGKCNATMLNQTMPNFDIGWPYRE